MVHCYKQNGYNIVLDTASGAIHSVDDLAFDVIGMYENESAETIISQIKEMYAAGGITDDDIREVIADIETLRASGKLYTPDTFFEVSENLKSRETPLKALCLNVAHVCNMTCRYCFAGKGEYGGGGLMPLETGKRAVDFLVENSGSRKNLDVDFFGGEPLLNWSAVKEIVRYAREKESKHGKKFRFTLTTNGLLIDDDVIEFTCREMHNVVLSLDGRPETHDRMRELVGGGGSFDAVLPKIKKLVDARGGKGYYIRGTFTHENLDFTEDILHMAELGFRELSLEPVVADEKSPLALTAEDLPKIFAQYEKLAMEMVERAKTGRGFTFYHYMLDLGGGPCIYKRLSGCGSGTEYLAVTPNGDIYPCHQFAGNLDFLLGNVRTGITNHALRKEFAGCNIYSREECRRCWARFYCTGGCAANAYNAQGTISGVYPLGCELFKKRVECAVMIKVAELTQNSAQG